MPALTIKTEEGQRRAAGRNAVSNRPTMFRRDGGGIAVFTAMKGHENGGMWWGRIESEFPLFHVWLASGF